MSTGPPASVPSTTSCAWPVGVAPSAATVADTVTGVPAGDGEAGDVAIVVVVASAVPGRSWYTAWTSSAVSAVG